MHIVGHSLGGVIARYYVQRMGGSARVDTLVTLGSPHTGTLGAYLVPTALGRQLRPGSAPLTELELPAPGCATRFLVVWSRMDQMVFPQRNARLQHPDLDVEELELQRRRPSVAADRRTGGALGRRRAVRSAPRGAARERAPFARSNGASNPSLPDRHADPGFARLGSGR